MFNLALLLTCLLGLSAQAAVVQATGSDFFKKSVEDSLALLPATFLDFEPGQITIGQSGLKSDHLLASEDLCRLSDGVTFGLTRGNKIVVSSRLVELAEKNHQVFNCGHRTFQKLLTAVIVHELTHVKDNKERISLSADFQRIVGIKRVTRNSRKSVMNQNTLSSPDAYEFENLEESLAVNTEFLVLDPEFECRKPATASYLSKRLNIPLKGQCQKNSNLIVQSAFLEDNYQLPVSIDSKRVYQIHYLFAGKGKALMSRWGHAMFRLVVCAPHRKVAGPECLNDVSHHVALSYRAYMTDLDISYVKGVAGGYPSQLFVLRYLEVQQEYTKFELRDLFSIPLRMTESQKKEFLDLTLERYWTYQGKYYFVDNNCGTEAVKHLQVALADAEEKLVSSLTPLKIFNDIIRHSNDLADENVNNLSREQMIERRFLAPSMKTDIYESFQFLKKFIPDFTEKSVERFIKKTTAAKRLHAYQTLLSQASSLDGSTQKQLAMKLSHFERYIASRYLMELPKKAMKMIDKDENLKLEVMKMSQGLKLLALQPWQVVKARYGAPLKQEFEASFPEFLKVRNEEVKMSLEAQMANLQSVLGTSYFRKELAEIEDLKKVKQLTIDFITQTNAI